MAISVKQKIAITLCPQWCLATPTEYRTVAYLFGVAQSTVCKIVQETCQAIVSVLLQKYISLPAGDLLDDVVDGFRVKWGVPQCMGAIDGSHIPVYAPKDNHTDYYNQKGFYSVILWTTVIVLYYVGWPGSVHDARVFAHSSLYHKLSSGILLPQEKNT